MIAASLRSRLLRPAAALVLASSGALAQEPLTTRCESAPIAALFKVFGDTGRMPPDLGRFLQTAALQKVEPYKAFDNVYYVGICWVSAWLVTSPSGHVLIDTLYVHRRRPGQPRGGAPAPDAFGRQPAHHRAGDRPGLQALRPHDAQGGAVAGGARLRAVGAGGAAADRPGVPIGPGTLTL
jgi:hypothetical protein